MDVLDLFDQQSPWEERAAFFLDMKKEAKVPSKYLYAGGAAALGAAAGYGASKRNKRGVSKLEADTVANEARNKALTGKEGSKDKKHKDLASKASNSPMTTAAIAGLLAGGAALAGHKHGAKAAKKAKEMISKGLSKKSQANIALLEKTAGVPFGSVDAIASAMGVGTMDVYEAYVDHPEELEKVAIGGLLRAAGGMISRGARRVGARALETVGGVRAGAKAKQMRGALSSEYGQMAGAASSGARSASARAGAVTRTQGGIIGRVRRGHLGRKASKLRAKSEKMTNASNAQAQRQATASRLPKQQPKPQPKQQQPAPQQQQVAPKQQQPAPQQQQVAPKQQTTQPQQPAPQQAPPAQPNTAPPAQPNTGAAPQPGTLGGDANAAYSKAKNWLMDPAKKHRRYLAAAGGGALGLKMLGGGGGGAPDTVNKYGSAHHKEAGVRSWLLGKAGKGLAGAGRAAQSTPLLGRLKSVRKAGEAVERAGGKATDKASRMYSSEAVASSERNARKLKRMKGERSGIDRKGDRATVKDKATGEKLDKKIKGVHTDISSKMKKSRELSSHSRGTGYSGNARADYRLAGNKIVSKQKGSDAARETARNKRKGKNLKADAAKETAKSTDNTGRNLALAGGGGAAVAYGAKDSGVTVNKYGSAKDQYVKLAAGLVQNAKLITSSSYTAAGKGRKLLQAAAATKPKPVALTTVKPVPGAKPIRVG